ncbi:MAG TPA: glycosyltransferase family 2 protein [Gemmatimonadaceae bacterium]|nr:glycosyltransferase family 2 protein [Gemmatimonadaceae bacterium]
MLATTFIVCLLLCGYVYGGYPVMLAIVARMRPWPVRHGACLSGISVIIPAFNEEGCIEHKVRSTLANGYPEQLLEVIVASDGSSDRTNELVRRIRHPKLQLLELPRQGKVAALNAAVREARGEIIVFTDADVDLDPGALSLLLRNFADPNVGGVTGRKAYRAEAGETTHAIARGEGLYVRFDEWQKHLESRIGSTISAHGALHALRKELYIPMRDPTAADDIAISVRVVLQGKRLIYEPDAIARVERPDRRSEFARKVRIANQAMVALFGLKRALWTSGFYSLQLISHKLLRYFVPIFLILMLITNALLALGSPFWRVLLALHAGFYAAAVAGFVLEGRRGAHRLLTVPLYFCTVNACALVALLSVVRNQRSATWAPGAGPASAATEASARSRAPRPRSPTPAAA